jgi:hypothetical protein
LGTSAGTVLLYRYSTESTVVQYSTESTVNMTRAAAAYRSYPNVSVLTFIFRDWSRTGVLAASVGTVIHCYSDVMVLVRG